MKLIKWLLTITILTVGVAYTALFTKTGNNIIIPIVEKTAIDKTKIKDIKITQFDLTFKSLNTTILLNNQKIALDVAFDLSDKTLDSSYIVDIKDISIFNHISKQNLKGSFFTKGRLKGKVTNLKLDGIAKVAKGDINYKLNIDGDDINNILVDIKSLDIATLLYMVNQPQYSSGKLNSDIKISSLEKLQGDITTTISKAVLNKTIVKKDFNISLPSNATYSLKANTNLDNNLISSNITLDSFAAKLTTKKTIFDISSTVLNTDYTLSVPNLQKLYFITNQKLRGDIKITGDLKFDKYVTTSFNSKKFNGTIDGTFIKDKLVVKISKVKTIPLLHMAYYPEIFRSDIDLKLNYNLTTSKGNAKIDLLKGQFLTSEFSQTIKKYIQKDLTQEIYDITKITTVIDNQKITNTLDMKSKNSSIKSDKIYLDLSKNYLNALFDFEFYGYKLGVTTKGDLTNPKVKFDMSKLINSQLKQKAKDKLNKVLKNKFKDTNVNNILKKELNKHLKNDNLKKTINEQLKNKDLNKLINGLF